VVAKKNGRPTGYDDEEIDPYCRDQIKSEPKKFISTAEELMKFLNRR